MLSSTLVLDDASGDDVTFVQVPFQGLGSRRIVTGRPGSLPHELVIQHQEAGKGGQPDRRVMSFRQTELDSKGVPQTFVLNVSMQIPRSDAITTQIINDNIALAASFLTDRQVASITAMTNVAAVSRGEA